MTFIEGPAGRLQYEFNMPNPIDPDVEPSIGVMDFDIGGNGNIALYLPVELRGISPLYLRIVLGSEIAGFADFAVSATGVNENMETYTGGHTWNNERWVFVVPGSVVLGATVMTNYRDFDFSVVTTAETTHIALGLERLDPVGGLAGVVFLMNARSLE